MSTATYTARAIVLRRTKLGESDLIVTFLADDGSQVRAVAKGARKPTSSFAARLELYSHVDMLLAKGRNLDIVKEVRLNASNVALRSSLELSTCASAGAELLGKVSQTGLSNCKLFALSSTAFSAMAAADVDHALAMCAALLLKTLAFSGVKPQLTRCVCCDATINLRTCQELVPVSCEEGGVVCPACARRCESVAMPAAALAWSETLLYSTFEQISGMTVDRNGSFGALRLCQRWTQYHVGANLKSLDFLFSCGLF
ncbi:MULTISPECIES: DNA repair protein RecO [unclassified Adlercreutzia]|uniref:DNA repair protein RecO n=1 Tax=unclassified Adlercreutzia TaxID=2636013 RepID=UPI0013ED139B|nr:MULTISPECIES: DNA repair protein RecO [unclassified Adlercreutzia]